MAHPRRQPGGLAVLTDRPTFPGGKRFAFTIIDDTDVATVENVRPVYRLLEELGMLATKTVWPVGCPEGSKNFSSSETLEDPEYRDFTVDLQRRGFEIASHGATMESSDRQRTLAGLEQFESAFGRFPRVHANHAYNRENLYWGRHRLDDPLLRRAYARTNGQPEGHYLGHVEGSPYWWGDLCVNHIEYVRNLTFEEVNLDRINPSMPYHDPSRPLVRYWFSASDAEDEYEFKRLYTRERLDRLEQDGGFSILATHLGKGFVRDGEVEPDTGRLFEEISERNGWFPTVAQLLDFLRDARGSDQLPRIEWRRMQWRWARDLVLRDRRKRARRRALARSHTG